MAKRIYYNLYKNDKLVLEHESRKRMVECLTTFLADMSEESIIAFGASLFGEKFKTIDYVAGYTEFVIMIGCDEGFKRQLKKPLVVNDDIIQIFIDGDTRSPS